MDAVKFIEERRRMFAVTGENSKYSLFNMNTPAEDVVKEVEEWSAAHPVTTRAALFKKTHPFVLSDSTGSLLICPVVVDKNVICPLNGECKQCRKNYWLKEVCK